MAGNYSPKILNDASREDAIAATTPRQAPPTDMSIPHARRNHWTGVAAGGLGGIAKAFLHPDLIVAGFIYAMTGKAMLVAMVTITSKAGILAFQLIVSSYFEHHARKMPLFAMAAAVRAVCYAGLAMAMWLLWPDYSFATLTLFFSVMLMAQICGGTGHVLFMDMIGRMIPRSRLGSFFGARHVLANVLAIATGLLAVQPILRGVPMPWNYIILIAIGGTMATLDMALFTRCRETDGPSARRRTTLPESIRRGFGWLRTDHNYRMFLWWRVAFRFNVLAIAFFIPYGAEKLSTADGVGFAMLGGVLVATLQVSRVLFSIIWGRLLDRHGFRPCLIGGGLCFILAPSLALLAPTLPDVELLSDWLLGMPVNVPLLVYLAALLVVGGAMQSTMMGGTHFIVSCAPPHRRPSYAGFAATITSPLTLLPLAAAWLADSTEIGLAAVFLLALVGGVGSLFAALSMKRHATGTTAEAAEPGGATNLEP